MAIFSLVARGRALSTDSSQLSSPLGSTASSDFTVRTDDAVSVESGFFTDEEVVDEDLRISTAAEDTGNVNDASAAAVAAAAVADINVADVAIVDFSNRTAVSDMDFLPRMVGPNRPIEVAMSIAARLNGTDRDSTVPRVVHANPTAGAATTFLSPALVLTPRRDAGSTLPLQSRALGAYNARDAAAGFDANRPAGSAMDLLFMTVALNQPIRGRPRTASESSVGDHGLDVDSAVDSEAGTDAVQASEGTLDSGGGERHSSGGNHKSRYVIFN